MIDPEIQQELQRLEDDLLRFTPSRRWQIITVQFPSTANLDLDIAHQLNPNDPEAVGFQILQSSSPCVVWKDTSANRTAWSRGIVRLRCTNPSAQVALVLFTTAVAPALGDYPDTPLIDPASTFTIGQASSGGSASIGTVSGGTGTGQLGGGIKFTASNCIDWALVAADDPYNDSLGFSDATNGVEVAKFYRTGADAYLFSPSEDGVATVKLGDHSDTDLIFDECAAAKFYERNDAGLGYWNTFTPSWTNLSVGNGTLTARYSQIGKVTLVEVFLIFGTTTSITGAVTIGSLPTNNSAVMQAQRLGEVGMFDASAGQTYSGAAFTSTATSANLLNNASPHTAVAAAVPFVWTTSDQLYVFLKYREA